MTSHSSLDAAALERKARLGQLRNLKRKQQGDPMETDDQATNDDTAEKPLKIIPLSGRNYDVETGAPKLGFDNVPSTNQETLEVKAAEIAEATKKASEEEESSNKAIDLFSLQPKKPNWDLKRDVDKKLERLELRTNSAIARLVRERVLAARKVDQGQEDGEGEAIGIEGNLSEAVSRREREIDAENKMEDDGDL